MAADFDVSEAMERAQKGAQLWAPGCTLVNHSRLTGGASSLTYRADVVGGPVSELVIKIAPPGLAPVRNRDVLRQARLLKALQAEPAAKAPDVYFTDAGAPVEIPPFFAMQLVRGESLEPNIDDVDSLPPAEIIEARALTAARMMAALHSVDPDAVGLGDDPEVTISDEVERWILAFGSVPDELRTGADEVGEALRKSLPASVAPSFVHGDFRLGNMQCNGPSVDAVIDWELWARSDPRIDLAWFLLSSDPDRHPSAKRHAPGMPGPKRLTEEYLAAGGRPVDEIEWFIGLILFKLCAVSALIAKNMMKRGDPDGIGASATASLPKSLAAARAAVTGAS